MRYIKVTCIDKTYDPDFFIVGTHVFTENEYQFYLGNSPKLLFTTERIYNLHVQFPKIHYSYEIYDSLEELISVHYVELL